MLMDICLPEFDIYQGKVAPNSFKSFTNSWCPDFFQKILLAWTRGIYLISVSQISCNSQVIRDGTLVIINKTILATTWGNQYFCFDCKRRDENGNMPPSH